MQIDGEVRIFNFQKKGLELVERSSKKSPKSFLKGLQFILIMLLQMHDLSAQKERNKNRTIITMGCRS
jgi:hypothetical protein